MSELLCVCVELYYYSLLTFLLIFESLTMCVGSVGYSGLIFVVEF